MFLKCLELLFASAAIFLLFNLSMHSQVSRAKIVQKLGDVTYEWVERELSVVEDHVASGRDVDGCAPAGMHVLDIHRILYFVYDFIPSCFGI